jgi:hypothetical protein
MSRDEEVKNPRLFDRRVVERNIKKGLITRKDYDKHLKALVDVAGNIASAEERAEEAADEVDDLPDEPERALS